MKNPDSSPVGTNPVPDFTPVQRAKLRHDGWTPARQRAFIAALAETGSVTEAAARVGKSTYGAYALRRAPGAESFERAWSAALDDGIRRLASIAFTRATDGVAIPLMHGGKQVGERRVYSDQLLTFMLRHYEPEKYGANPGLRPGTTGASRRAQEEDGQSDEQRREELLEVRARIAGKLRMSRDLFVRAIAHDRKARAAWDRLCPRVNWKVASEFAPRLLEDGTPQRLFMADIDQEFPKLRRPEYIIPVTNGFAPELSDPDYDEDGDPIEQLVASVKAAAELDDEAEDAADKATDA